MSNLNRDEVKPAWGSAVADEPKAPLPELVVSRAEAANSGASE
jgi:hypothetical protein